MEIVKIGPVEMTVDEAQECYEKNLYILTYSKVYQVMYSTAQKRYYGHVLFNKGGARRGRFYKMCGKQINDLFGCKVVIE